ncbi:MAG: hypothetical protein AAFX54_15375 [Pseudomonadota bacterium]
MKKMFVTLAIAALMPLSNSYAATFSDWSNATRVTVTTNRTNIYIAGTVPNPAGCSLTDYITVHNSSGNYEALTATAMSAVAGSFEIRMQINESACSADRPAALFVSFRN